MRRALRVSLFLSCLLAAAAAFAQEGMPKPGAEHKKLDYFVGNWTSDADMKPSPMGPGGKFVATEHTEWMEGGYFVVIHSSYKSTAMGNGSGVAFMGYDFQDKVYTYDEFNSSGEHNHSTGTLDGDTLTWLSDIKAGPQTVKGRFTMKLLPPDAYAYKFEVSADGKAWSLIMEGKDTKDTKAK
jgi:hypothetical protein